MNGGHGQAGDEDLEEIVVSQPSSARLRGKSKEGGKSPAKKYPQSARLQDAQAQRPLLHTTSEPQSRLQVP